MNWSWTLLMYLTRQFIGAVALVLGGLLALALGIDLADLFNRTAQRDVPTDIVLGMALLKLPDIAQEILPFCILFAAILAFFRQSKSHELVAARAAGVSAWQFLTPPMGVAVLLGFLTMAVFNPVAATLLSKYEQLESRYIKGQASQLAVSQTGLWLRQGDNQQQSVVHALKVSEQGTKLAEVIVFVYDGEDRLSGRIDAAEATLENRNWRLSDAWVSDASARPVYRASYDLPTNLTPAQILESFASPGTISFWELPRFIANAEAAGFSALRHKLHWYALLALPLLFSAMVLMAASFSLRLARLGGVSRLVLAAAIAGFAVYLLGQFTGKLGDSGILPLWLAAMAPAIVALLLGATLLFHEEDG